MRTISVTLLEEIVTIQQHFPGEVPGFEEASSEIMVD